jgi:hypothetical protein
VFIGSEFDVVATNNDNWTYAASMFSKFDVEIATVLPVASEYLKLHRQLSGRTTPDKTLYWQQFSVADLATRWSSMKHEDNSRDITSTKNLEDKDAAFV